MQKTPCEFIMWRGLPVIRKEIAASLVHEYGLSQRQAALKLGITPAAVSQYFSKKRGNTSITDPLILSEITKSAEKICANGHTIVLVETCRICRFMKKHNGFQFEDDACCDESLD
ncbi:MAG: helix-turn-helix domain-containing protein [Candidatus Thermoplasmatota archaeon]|nr:helix-turn-helix domain-containing protein [Candidatus Thermoplasmatota archaeon]MBU1940505.1 helix-turn-helix domain-containing protein [Candidatus Thermoplasmatota archaeon]